MADFEREFINALENAATHALNDGLAEAKRLSSGPFSQSQLNAMDNPFATRHALPGLPPEIINDQSAHDPDRKEGESFLEYWKQKPVQISGGDVTGGILNDSPIADFLKDGTRFMIPRPIEETVEKFTEEELNKRLTEQIRAFEKKDFHV